MIDPLTATTRELAEELQALELRRISTARHLSEISSRMRTLEAHLFSGITFDTVVVDDMAITRTGGDPVTYSFVLNTSRGDDSC